MDADATCSWDWPDPYDFFETTRLLRTGGGDPTVRREPNGLWRTVRLPEGPATVRLKAIPRESIEAQAWGAGAQAALERVPLWLGLDLAPLSLPPHPVTDRLLREHRGVRLNNTGDVFEALVCIILQQKVTWQEAAFCWRRLTEKLGEPAPGPAGMRLAPTPRAIRAAGVERLVQLGIARQRARTIHEVAFSARRLEQAALLPSDDAQALLQKVRGVGPWTSALVLGMRLARPDPIVRGDLKLPSTVCWALAGEPRADDARMEELLEPFPGQAFDVIRLIFAARIEAPRRGPRRELSFGPR